MPTILKANTDVTNYLTYKYLYVQSTAYQTIHFGLSTAVIYRELALISNCKCIASC
jgi:hypothetical protein